MIVFRGLALFGTMLLLSCASGPTSRAQIEACIDSDRSTLLVIFKNIAFDSILVASKHPHVGCCAEGELSIFVVDEQGIELQRCGYLDGFIDNKIVTLHKNEDIVYSLSVLSLEKHYCDAILTRHSVAAAFVTERNDTPKELLRISAPISEHCPWGR